MRLLLLCAAACTIACAANPVVFITKPDKIVMHAVFPVHLQILTETQYLSFRDVYNFSRAGFKMNRINHKIALLDFNPRTSAMYEITDADTSWRFIAISANHLNNMHFNAFVRSDDHSTNITAYTNYKDVSMVDNNSVVAYSNGVVSPRHMGIMGFQNETVLIVRIPDNHPCYKLNVGDRSYSTCAAH